MIEIVDYDFLLNTSFFWLYSITYMGFVSLEHLSICKFILYTTDILYTQVRFVEIKHHIQFAVHLNDCHLTLFQSKLIQQIAAPQLERNQVQKVARWFHFLKPVKRLSNIYLHSGKLT